MEKATSIEQTERVFVALGIRHAMRTRHIVLCGLPHSTILFPHYRINGTIVENELLNTKCVFRYPLQLLPETFLILRRIERDIIKKSLVCTQSTRYSYPILMKLEFSRLFSKNDRGMEEIT